MIPNPQTHYGKSKLKAEKYIQEQTIPEGKRIYILRLSMIHGPNNRGNLNLLYQFAQKVLIWPLGAFKNKRTFTLIQNVIFELQGLVENNIKPGIYQIADDESISTNEPIQLMAESLHRKIYIWNISPHLIRLIAILGDKFGLSLNSHRLNKLTVSYQVSNQKLKNAYGIESMPFRTIDGLKLTLESFRKV